MPYRLTQISLNSCNTVVGIVVVVVAVYPPHLGAGETSPRHRDRLMVGLENDLLRNFRSRRQWGFDE